MSASTLLQEGVTFCAQQVMIIFSSKQWSVNCRKLYTAFLRARIWDTRKLMLIETGTPIEGDDDGSSSLEVKPPTVLEAENEIVTNFLSSKPGQGCILGQFEHKQSATAAFWDSRGERIVSTSYDNNLRSRFGPISIQPISTNTRTQFGI